MILQNEFVSMFFFVSLALAAILLAGWYLVHWKPIKVAVVAFSILAVIGFLSLSGVHSDYPGNGLHKVYNVDEPTYATGSMDLTLHQADENGYYSSDRLTGLSLDAIPGFDPCCEKNDRDCGCLETRKKFWTASIEVKAVPCPDGSFPKFSCKGK